MTITTLIIPEIDSIRAITRIFKFTLCEIKRNGLRIRKRRKTFMKVRFVLVRTKSTNEKITMIKSS